MAWRSFGYEVTPMAAARRSPRVVRAPSPPQELQAPIGQSFDDMIEEIRRLRANVWPRGLHPEALQESTEELRLSPSNPGTEGPELSSRWLSPSPSRASRASRASRGTPTPGVEPSTLEHSGLRATPRTRATPSDRRLKRPPPWSPLRPTLWEERQVRRCLQEWHSLSASGASAVHRAYASEDHLPPALAPSVASRLDRCWHAWRRLVQSDRAGELELSVQLLRMQMARSQRRCIHWWHRWAERGPGRNDRRRFRPCAQRMALRRWREALLEKRQWQAMRDQVMSLLRISTMRRTLHWLAHLHVRPEKVRRQQRRALARQAHYRQSLRKSWLSWVRYASLSRRRLHAQQRLDRNQAAQALGRLRRWVRERRHLQDRLRVAQIQRKAHTLLSRLQTWHRTVRGRRQRQVQLEGHLRNCRQPRRARCVLSAWATWTRQEQRNQATLHKARIVLDLSLKSRSFHAWLQRRLSVSKAQEQLRGVLGRLDSSASVLCLAQWRHAALRQAKERSVLTALASGLERILQRGALHDLLETMRVARRHAHLAETLQHVQNRSIFARTLALWRAAARRRHLGTQRLRGLHGRFEESSFARCWVGWRLMAQQVRQERQAIHTLAAGLGCLRKAGALQRLRRHARHVSLNEQLEGWQHARLARRMLRRWEALYRANGFRQHQQSRVLIARILGAWLVLTLHSLELAHYRVTQGLARRAGFLLQLAIYWWWTALQKIRQFKVLVPVLVDSLAEATSAHGRRSQWSAWQRWWRIVEASRFAEAEELLYMSFQSWRSGIIEQRHKRGVHLLCERYRDVRMKRKSLFAWKRRLERLSAVTSSVEFWAAGRCSNAAQRALRGWREAARRRASARQGAQRMLQRRRCAFLASWRLLMLRKITAMGLQEAVLLSRALRWLRAWSGWAFAHARQRQSDEVKWAIVRQSRQRWVLERWCSAGRFQRLVLVAEKWDGQVLCRQLVLRAFTGWSAMMGLYACGEKVAAAVGARRASRLLRHWSFLLLVGEKRPHHLMRQMLARWRLFKHRSGEVQRGLERLGRWTLAPTFRRWATYLRDRKTRQQMASTHGDRMQASSSRRAQATALRWWHHSTQEVRRERRLDAQNGHDLERESERQLAVARVRQKGVLNLWREALLFHKAALWQQERPRLVMDITGQSWMATSFRVLAQRSRKRLKTRKAQEVVQATLARRRRARYFDLWAQVFEMESSSFFASQILGRGKLKRILDRWKQHTTFHAGFASQVLKTLQQSNLQRLQRAFRGWQERLHLRRLVAGMWLFRRRSWINAVFMAWNDEAVKAASTRRHLRSFFQAVRYSKASRAGSLQRKRVHGRLTGKVFRAYATWVKRAKVIQARSTQLNRAVRAGRKTQRLGAWAMYCRAFSVASSRAGEIFRAWLVQARRKKALTWASRSLAADTVRHAYTEGLQNLRSWAVFRRTLRQMVAGRRSTLLSSVLYCWVAALMPARHAVAELQRRAQLRLLLVFDAWARRATVVRRRHSQAQAVGDRSRLQRSREVAAGWFQQQKRLTAARRVFQVLDRVDRRWTGEEDWMRRAVADKNLQAMFRRFAEALDQQSSSQGSLLLRGAFQSVIAMVWARQQLSVVLGRLRGYFQPWLLGWWPMSSYPLLSPEDPYFMQAEIRLRVMMSQLDALRAQEQQPSVYKLMQDSEPNSKLISWQALADLLVVHHPGTATGRPRNPAPKTILEPVAKGIVPLAPHFGRDARQRAWLLPFSGCGDTAGGPIPWSYDSGSESAVSFGTPAFGSGDQAAGILV